MLEKSFGILFFLKKSKHDREKSSIIYLRITVDGARKEISTKRNWEFNRWNPHGGRATGSKEDAKTLNQYLDLLQTKVYDSRRVLVERGDIVSADAIMNIITGEEQRSRKLLRLFADHNREMERAISKGVSKGTYINFAVSYNHVKKFIATEYKTDDISIVTLNLEFIKKLYRYFKVDLNFCHNSAIKNIANMKKIVLSCVDNGWLVADPFAKFPMNRQDVKPTFLMQDELKAISEKEIKIERLSKIRDIYIFCCYTSLSFIDVKQLRRSEVTIGIDGQLWIIKDRQKTNVTSQIPLLPVTLAILKKYENDPECILKDTLLPVPSNQKYNAYLKELAGICGIEKELTSHTARHTFATSVTI